MLTLMDCPVDDVTVLLDGGSFIAVCGSEITIREARCAQGRQIGAGCDEHGRLVVFSLSLADGRGIARLIGKG